MKGLTLLANKYKSDKGTTTSFCHEFSEVYDDHLKEKVDSYMNILEIGVNDGASLKMWYDYFPNAKIYGLDINDKNEFNNDRIKCIKLDQSNEDELKNFIDIINIEYDFIIDDGSHHMKDQQITLAYLFKLLKPGGIYVIEDLHTSLCENGTDVYGRPIEVHNNGNNTTLNFLEKKPYNSVYLNNELNLYLQNNIKDVKIFKKNNLKVPKVYKEMSITSIINKNSI